MRTSLLLLILAVAGCATPPGAADPEAFRAASTLHLEKDVASPFDLVASNLVKNGITCWDSEQIRTHQFKEPGRYVVTIGVYTELTKQILIMADAIDAGDKTRVIVSARGEGHRAYAQNLLNWAIGSEKTCNSPMRRAS